jgi:hypothetical protein
VHRGQGSSEAMRLVGGRRGRLSTTTAAPDDDGMIG